MEAMSGAGKEETLETNTPEPGDSGKTVGRGVDTFVEADTGCGGSLSGEKRIETATPDTGEEESVQSLLVVIRQKGRETGAWRRETRTQGGA